MNTLRQTGGRPPVSMNTLCAIVDRVTVRPAAGRLRL